MKIVRYRKDGQSNYGVLQDQMIKQIAGKPYEQIAYTGEEVSLSEVKLLAPCEPEKIIAVGLNYLSHAKEIKMEIPEVPLLFFKPTSAIVGDGEDIVRPTQSKQVEAVAAVRRSGGIPTVDALNKFISYAEMIMPASNYWNVAHGLMPGEIEQDEEGKQIMEVLGKNMAWILKLIEHGKEQLPAPAPVEKAWTHFIR